MKEEWLFNDDVDADQIWEANGHAGEKRKYLKQVKWNIYIYMSHAILLMLTQKWNLYIHFDVILNLRTTYYPAIPFLITYLQ